MRHKFISAVFAFGFMLSVCSVSVSAYDENDPYFSTLDDSAEVQQWVEDAKKLKESVEEQINIKVSDFVTAPSEEIKAEIKRDLDTLYYENASLAYGINGAIYGTFGHTFNDSSKLYAGFFKDTSGRYHNATAITADSQMNGNAFCPISTDIGSFIVKYRQGSTPVSGRWISNFREYEVAMQFRPSVSYQYSTTDVYFSGNLIYSIGESYWADSHFLCGISGGASTVDLPNQANRVIVTNLNNAIDLFGARTSIPTNNLSGKNIYSFDTGSMFLQLRDDSPNPDAWIEPETPTEPTEPPTDNPEPIYPASPTLPDLPELPDTDFSIPDGFGQGLAFWFGMLDMIAKKFQLIPLLIICLTVGTVLFFLRRKGE